MLTIKWLPSSQWHTLVGNLAADEPDGGMLELLSRFNHENSPLEKHHAIVAQAKRKDGAPQTLPVLRQYSSRLAPAPLHSLYFILHFVCHLIIT
ncbi:hypothetical protein ACUN9V_11870 [Salinicola sp. V024]|uniref:hypothetical protein n=1 Tax=Salinicola sp. V024 TaxID=3459609 RepID=UPI004044D5A4